MWNLPVDFMMANNVSLDNIFWIGVAVGTTTLLVVDRLISLFKRYIKD